MGGKISEGMDFPSEELEVVVIVGIPYPPPSARQHALQIYYDKKYGNGWKYAFEAPAVRKTLQAIGRLIRKESDKGVAIILDERARRFQKYEYCNKMNLVWKMQLKNLSNMQQLLYYPLLFQQFLPTLHLRTAKKEENCQ